MHRMRTVIAFVVIACAAASAVAMAAGDGAPLANVRVLRTSVPGYAEALSPDGRLLAFAIFKRHRYDIALLDLASNRLRRLPGSSLTDERRIGDGNYLGVAGFSPDSKLLLARSGQSLVTVDAQSGRRQVVARRVPWGPAGWLDDGRVAFIDGQRRLVFAARGGRLERTRFRAARLVGSVPSWSPNGRYVLYARACTVWRLDLRTGNRRRIAGRTGDGIGAGFSPGPWSPNGRYFLLRASSWDDRCSSFDDFWARRSIRSADGSQIGSFRFPGGTAWSTDSRSVLGFPYITGTEVAKFQPLEVFDLAARKQVELLRNRLAGGAFLGPGGWLVYGRYVTATNSDGRIRLYLAQLSPRWR